MYRLTFLLTTAVILIASCAQGPETVPAEGIPDLPTGAILGTVQFRDVEGGCWRILADDGTSYEPMKVPRDFLKDGLRVAVVFGPPEDERLGSICQVGILATVEWIEEIDSAVGPSN